LSDIGKFKRIKGVKLSREVSSAWREMVADRRDLHMNPEPAFKEKRTASIVAERLRTWGYEVKEGIAGTGVCGHLKGGKQGRIVAVRADMDALPLDEKGKSDYKSKVKGVMHACGHDGHVAIALKVAEILASERETLKGGVKFIFQPAEEGPGGALPMIEEGVLKEPEVDFILALHLWNHLPVGKVGIREGRMMASTDVIRMNVKGKGGHGAAPHQTVDAILVAARIVDALQSIISRSIDPVEPAVITVGTISGGAEYNIIAEEVVMSGTTRAYNENVRKSFPGLIRKVAGGVARAHGARFSLNYEWQYPPLENNGDIAGLMREVAAKVVGTEGVIDPGLQMTAEDMAFFLKEVPGCFFFVGAHNTSRGKEIPHHNPSFDFDERAMLVGAEVILNGVRTLSGLRT
jgi:amidohydrolase